MNIGIYPAHIWTLYIASWIKTSAHSKTGTFFLSYTCFQDSVTFAIYMFLYQIGTVPSIAAA